MLPLWHKIITLSHEGPIYRNTHPVCLQGRQPLNLALSVSWVSVMATRKQTPVPGKYAYPLTGTVDTVKSVSGDLDIRASRGRLRSNVAQASPAHAQALVFSSCYFRPNHGCTPVRDPLADSRCPKPRGVSTLPGTDLAFIIGANCQRLSHPNQPMIDNTSHRAAYRRGRLPVVTP